jgi:hypothetical protein
MPRISDDELDDINGHFPELDLESDEDAEHDSADSSQQLPLYPPTFQRQLATKVARKTGVNYFPRKSSRQASQRVSQQAAKKVTEAPAKPLQRAQTKKSQKVFKRPQASKKPTAKAQKSKQWNVNRK